MGTGPVDARVVTLGVGQLGHHLLAPIWEVMLDLGDRSVASSQRDLPGIGQGRLPWPPWPPRPPRPPQPPGTGRKERKVKVRDCCSGLAVAMTTRTKLPLPLFWLSCAGPRPLC